MIEVLVNADDFGFSRAVNYGILNSHKNGIVNSATMMMNAKATDHAIRIAKDHRTLKVGIHLVLTCGRPLLHDVPSLVDREGNFKKQDEVYGNPGSISLEELEREWSAQIDKFIDLGMMPTHFDSHHHVHAIPAFWPVVKKLSAHYGLPVRKAGPHFQDIETVTDTFLDDFYGEKAAVDYFQTLNERISEGKSVEVMTHPAYLDDDLLQHSSYNQERLKETAILMKATLPEGFILR
ncbi:chitin disaccharide deacetylase [Peribacillus sp. NPDC097224]|uniref:chitin disaccharide deacetylase n=1 Tax=Peribacillus sp. NPDC097224 TaxID=3364399 RepID=UPI00382DE7B3